MISMLSMGHMKSCAAKSRDGKMILYGSREPYLPPLGQNIRSLRLSRNMTQRQLAYYLKVSTQAVSKWEREQAYPDMTLLVPISRLFGVTLDELFGCR